MALQNLKEQKVRGATDVVGLVFAKLKVLIVRLNYLLFGLGRLLDAEDICCGQTQNRRGNFEENVHDEV